MATVTTTPQAFTDESFETFLAERRHEPAWLTDIRKAAWSQFRSQAWPARNHEEWIRTDIRAFKLDRYAAPIGLRREATLPPHARGGMLCPGVALGGRVTTVDSAVVDWHLHDHWAQKGVIFGGFDDMIVAHGDRLKPYLFSKLKPSYDRFSALQAAFFAGGPVLLVPRGVAVTEPLHVLAAISEEGVDLSHTLVVLEDGAEATVLCEQCSPGEEAGGFHCGATELYLGRGSNLRFVNLQDWGHKVWHFAHQHAVVGQDASLQWTVAAMGSRLAKVNQTVTLSGKGAWSQVNGVLFAEGTQHISYHTLQHHAAPGCKSDFLYKTALQDKARTVWRGMIRVDKEAQKTDGYQRNDNLLLSATARADSIPGLEIEADDVRCTHGSTTGRVDEELVFYACCRGFTRTEAIQAVVTGFFQQIFDRITIENVRDALGLAIARRVREYE